MSSSEYNLVVVAHPDDEAIFFCGPILQRRQIPWKAICVTDGNGDGEGAKRRGYWAASMEKLGISEHAHWSYPDIFEKRLDTASLEQDLGKLPMPTSVFTHGILGEYGHPHHQDVAYAVHRTFAPKAKVYSPASNCPATLKFDLTREQYRAKLDLLLHTYGDQYNRFANQLAATEQECFHELSIAECEYIYLFFQRKLPMDAKRLGKLAHLAEHLQVAFASPVKRRF
jgi:LmbE family N-acetylglucosaminyl deacetylase